MKQKKTTKNQRSAPLMSSGWSCLRKNDKLSCNKNDLEMADVKDPKIIYRELNNLFQDYMYEYDKFRNGSNKKIRSEGERRIDTLLERARFTIFNNGPIKKLFDEEIRASGDSEAFFIDEFFDWNYFHRDMPAFLERIRAYIESGN